MVAGVEDFFDGAHGVFFWLFGFGLGSWRLGVGVEKCDRIMIVPNMVEVIFMLGESCRVARESNHILFSAVKKSENRGWFCKCSRYHSHIESCWCIDTVALLSCKSLSSKSAYGYLFTMGRLKQLKQRSGRSTTLRFKKFA